MHHRGIFIICLLSAPALAQTAGVDLAKPTQVKVIQPAGSPKKRKQEGMLDEKPKPAPHTVEWGGDITYGARTDLADKAKPRLYVHSLDLSYGLNHLPTHIAVGASVGATYESTGERNGTIVVNSSAAELFVSDVDLSVDKSISLVAPFKLSVGVDNEFPTSPDARREGYNSVTSVNLAVLASWFEKRVAADVKSSYTYIWNSYRYSPATLDLNKRSGWKTSLGSKLKLWLGFYLAGSVGTQLSTYMDGSTDQTYRNSVSLGYNWENFTVAASYSNGTYLNQEDATIWFIDEYRRTASLRMSFNF